MLQEELQNVVRQIDELKARRRMLEEKLLLEEAGKRDTLPAKRKVGKCLEVGDSMLRKVSTEHADIMVECILGV
jgi:hypothetical protein